MQSSSFVWWHIHNHFPSQSRRLHLKHELFNPYVYLPCIPYDAQIFRWLVMVANVIKPKQFILIVFWTGVAFWQIHALKWRTNQLINIRHHWISVLHSMNLICNWLVMGFVDAYSRNNVFKYQSNLWNHKVLSISLLLLMHWKPLTRTWFDEKSNWHCNQEQGIKTAMELGIKYLFNVLYGDGQPFASDQWQ